MSYWRRVPLRLRLVTSLLALAMVALVISGLAGGRLLRNYLVSEVDQDLATALHDVLEQDVIDPDLLVTPFYVTGLDRDGQELGPQRIPHPPDLSNMDEAAVRDQQQQPFTAHSRGSDEKWRVIAAPAKFSNVDGSLVIAINLDEVDDTVARLRAINLLVGLAVLGGLAAAAYWTISNALRPLADMEDTAAAIASGDITRRVPDADADPQTEVGSFGQAFNTMLDQIEVAFRAQRDSETTARRSEAKMRQFIADASHELRTPLTSIRGFSELYRQGAVTDQAAVSDVLQRIEHEATRMGVLVDDLLLLARLDQERPLANDPLELASIVRETVEAARATAPDRELALDIADNQTVTGDGSRLRQVVTNLVDNALRHTPDESPVEIRLTSRSQDDREWAVLEVTDHGPGLTEEQAERVFERFYRTDTARSRQDGGSGLGLSIVAAVVAAHGGWAEVDSTPGDGTTFRVHLPLSRPSPSEIAPISRK